MFNKRLRVVSHIMWNSRRGAQSSQAPHRIHWDTVKMTDWKWILSDIPISPSPETFAYFVRVLHVF